MKRTSFHTVVNSKGKAPSDDPEELLDPLVLGQSAVMRCRVSVKCSHVGRRLPTLIAYFVICSLRWKYKYDTRLFGGIDIGGT